MPTGLKANAMRGIYEAHWLKKDCGIFRPGIKSVNVSLVTLHLAAVLHSSVLSLTLSI